MNKSYLKAIFRTFGFVGASMATFLAYVAIRAEVLNIRDRITVFDYVVVCLLGGLSGSILIGALSGGPFRRRSENFEQTLEG